MGACPSALYFSSNRVLPLHVIEPMNETEDIFLNFLKFHDKHLQKRLDYRIAERFKAEHPNPTGEGTDYDHHGLAQNFILFGGPDYFRGNSDVKWRPWRPHPDGSCSDSD